MEQGTTDPKPADWVLHRAIYDRSPIWDRRGPSGISTNVHPTHFGIISDSAQKTLNTPEKVEMELWSNGFIGNTKCNSPGRLCFASHAAEAENMYSGGFNMQLSSQITIELEFAEHVNYRVFAVQLQRVTVNSLGLVQASLD